MPYITKTQFVKVDPTSPDPHVIRQAAEALRKGRLVAFPTETVYGLGANALDATAIDRIYHAKQRPPGDPIIVHIHDVAQLEQLAVDMPESVNALAERFWPGPLTLVLRRAPGVPQNIASGRDTIAVRMPAHPVSVALLKAADIPIAAPSANTFSRPSATTAAHVLDDLDGRVDIILDGGTTTIGLESTVLDLTREAPTVLRPGGLAIADLRTILPNAFLTLNYVGRDSSEVSPGQMLKHYSPRAQVILFQGERNAVLEMMRMTTEKRELSGIRVGVMIADEDAPYFEAAGHPPTEIKTLGSRHDLNTISRNLFAGLRSLDSRGVDVLLSRDFGQDGLGEALWDRLVRAAEGRVVVVEG